MVKRATLPAVPESPEFWEKIEQEIIRVFKRELYLPLMRELGQRTIKNSQDPLGDAIKSGRVIFERGRFSGKFGSDISKQLRGLGAIWDRKTSTYQISKADLPYEILAAISTSEHHFERKIEQIDERLSRVTPEQLADLLRTEKLFDRSLWQMDKRVTRSLRSLKQVKKVAKGLQVPAQLTPEMRKRIASEWQDNMKLWIEDFTKKEIGELRAKMKQSVFAGNRYESAIRTIHESFGVTKRKAKFLASQETRLLLCKFKETRYADAGVRQYKWKCVAGSKAHPVRPRHQQLNDESQKGKIFRFDQPPVSTGAGEPVRRNNPGEDYNCRCVAIPVVDFRPVKA